MRAKAPTGKLAFPARLETAEAPKGTLLATLAARALIRDLEEGASPLHTRRGSLQGRNTKDKVKEEIVRLGMTYGLVSRETSYVAVEERENPETGEMTLKKVPIALTRGWGGADPRMMPRSSASAGIAASISAPDVAYSLEKDRGLERSYCRSEDTSGKEFSIERSMSPAQPRDMLRKLESVLSRKRSALARRLATDGASVSTPKGPSVRALDQLVALQKADGSWDLDAELAMLLGIPLATTENAFAGIPGDPALLRRACATALALFWLERSAADEEDEWRLLARKARAWLSSSGVLPPGGGLWNAFAAAILGSRPGA